MIISIKCPICGNKKRIYWLEELGAYFCGGCRRYFIAEGTKMRPVMLVGKSKEPAGPDSVAADQGHAEKAPATFEEAFDAIIAELWELMVRKQKKTFDDIVAELKGLMVRKQRDYGHENIMAFGGFGVLVRLNDKVERLKNLLGKGKEPANESVEDSWKDTANYAIIALMLRRGIFTLPLGEEAKNAGNL